MTTITIAATNFRNADEALTIENINKNTCDMLAALRTNTESLIAAYEADIVKTHRTSGITSADARQLKLQVKLIDITQAGRARMGKRFALKSSFATA